MCKYESSIERKVLVNALGCSKQKSDSNCFKKKKKDHLQAYVNDQEFTVSAVAPAWSQDPLLSLRNNLLQSPFQSNLYESGCHFPSFTQLFIGQ